MKKIAILFLLIAFTIILIPSLIVFKLCPKKASPIKISEKINVYIKESDSVKEMDVNQYLKEVVSAEMPADFHYEALKSQAVAARTYLVNRMRAFENSEKPEVHKGADICTDSTHCKAWISEKERKKLWDKDKANDNWKKISDAVESTKNLIATYNEEPISAVFHSTSSGYTENSKDVWGGDKPYLVSVKSDGDLQSPKYKSEKIFTIEEFKKIAEENIEGVLFDNYLIGEITRSDSGGIISLDVGGILVKGSDFRFMYGLRSTNINFEITEKEIKMNVLGYGHGVGMSQYGANYLASQGKNFEDILKHYYHGIKISEIKSYNQNK